MLRTTTKHTQNIDKKLELCLCGLYFNWKSSSVKVQKVLFPRKRKHLFEFRPIKLCSLPLRGFRNSNKVSLFQGCADGSLLFLFAVFILDMKQTVKRCSPVCGGFQVETRNCTTEHDRVCTAKARSERIPSENLLKRNPSENLLTSKCLRFF